MAAKITVILMCLIGAIAMAVFAALAITFAKGIKRSRYDHRVGGVIKP